MNSRIIDIKEVRADEHEWKGSFLALHEDGSFSRIEAGSDAKGYCVLVTPLRMVTE